MFIVDTETFRAAAEAIANLRPCPFAGRVTADQIKIELGERLNVWPASIWPGLEIAGEDESAVLAPEVAERGLATEELIARLVPEREEPEPADDLEEVLAEMDRIPWSELVRLLNRP